MEKVEIGPLRARCRKWSRRRPRPPPTPEKVSSRMAIDGSTCGDKPNTHASSDLQLPIKPSARAAASQGDAFSRAAAAARFRHAAGCGGGRGVRRPRSRPAGGLGGLSHAATTSAKRGVARTTNFRKRGRTTRFTRARGGRRLPQKPSPAPQEQSHHSHSGAHPLPTPTSPPRPSGRGAPPPRGALWGPSRGRPLRGGRPSPCRFSPTNPAGSASCRPH